MATAARYKSILVKLMSYLDGIDYEQNHEFTLEQLGALTPAHLIRWFNMRAYGTEEPDKDAVLMVRSTALEFWKKAISSNMPNKMLGLNQLSNVGNPTQSVLL